MIRSFPTTLMQDPVFRLRTPDARLVLFTLWMHPSNHLSGLFVLDLDHLALDVRLPLERSTPALRELTDHGLVLRHAPLDQLWLPRMAALLGNLGNGDAPVHKAVSKYVHGLVPSTLCHRVLDSLSIPYRNAADLPELCAWLPADGCSVPQVTPSDTLSNRVPDRVLSVSVSGIDSGSGSASLVDSEPLQPELALVPQQAADSSKASAKPSKAQIQAQVALGLFGELVAARMSVIAGAEQLQPRPAALAGIKACLGHDYTPEQIRHVIKLKVAEVKADPEQAKWFVPTWFRPTNVERYLALKEADVARKPRGQAPQAMRPPEPPKSACNPPGGIDFKALREKVESQRTPEGDAKIKAELDIILGRSS